MKTWMFEQKFQKGFNWHIGWVFEVVVSSFTLGPPDTGRSSVVVEHLGHQPPEGETSAKYLCRRGEMPGVARKIGSLGLDHHFWEGNHSDPYPFWIILVILVASALLCGYAVPSFFNQVGFRVLACSPCITLELLWTNRKTELSLAVSGVYHWHLNGALLLKLLGTGCRTKTWQIPQLELSIPAVGDLERLVCSSDGHVRFIPCHITVKVWISSFNYHL